MSADEQTPFLDRVGPAGSLSAEAAAPSSPGVSALSIGPEDASQRLDRFLRKVLPQASLGQIFGAVRRGEVRVNAARVEAGYRLRVGDRVELGPGLEAALRPRPGTSPPPAAPADLQIVHRDSDLLVVIKPAGLALHPGTGVREHLVGRVHARFGGGSGHSFRIAPAHRLDRDTSGLVVFGLSAAGLRGFTASLREGRVAKSYLALVHGSAPARGEIDLPLQRAADAAAGARMRPSLADGVAALTRFARLEQRRGHALLAVELVTGRTHQIRAHLAAIGLPIVGDRRYGRADGADRLHLHAWRLRCPHPVTGLTLELEAPPPPAMQLP